MHRLFSPIDIASLVFFRIIFGLLAMAEVMALFFYYHLKERSFEPDGFQFKYYGFEWVQPFPEPFQSIFFSVVIICAICVAMGKWYRYTAPLFAIGFIYAFLLEKTHYLNHGYFLCWLAVVMCFLPANRAFSMDVVQNPAIRRKTIPLWCIAILCFLMGVVYFFGGIAKINPDWLQAMPLKMWLQYKSDMPVLGGLWEQEWVAWFMAYGGLSLDLFVAFFLLIPRTRIYAFGFAVFFHLTNVIIFKIGVFPWLSIGLTLLYFPPSTPRRWVEFLASRIGFVRRWQQRWNERFAANPIPDTPIWQTAPHYRTAITAALICIGLFHVTYPLRHHLIPGNVAWTEEGHRYAWRMMLRSKQGRAQLTVEDSQTGETWVINPRDSLSRDQANDVVSHPDMLLQYAHHLRDQYQERLGNKVAVYADVRLRLNGRSYQDYIDSDVDLAQEDWSFFRHSEWILPFEEDELD
jgi:vitamin K-dependent gamma-carboxylase